MTYELCWIPVKKRGIIRDEKGRGRERKRGRGRGREKERWGGGENEVSMHSESAHNYV